MNSFTASYKNELMKFTHRKKYIVALIIGICICVMIMVISKLLTNFAISANSSALSMVGINMLRFSPMTVHSFFSVFMLPLMMFMATTDLLTMELADNTIKASLLRPILRWKLYAAKLCAVVTYAAFYLGVIFVVTSILGLIYGTEVRVTQYLTHFLSYVLTIVPLAVLACFAGVVAQLGKSGTLSMLILIFSYVVLLALPVVFPALNELIFTSYIGWYKLWIGIIPAIGKQISMLCIVIGYGSVFFFGGSVMFDKKDC